MYSLATYKDLSGIVQLQQSNLKGALDTLEWNQEGFVTVQHDVELLDKMNTPHPHTVAKVNGEVVGYCLVMLPSMKLEIPILFPLFEKLKQLEYQGKKLSLSNYFVMGQVCIAKAYRGKGVFKGMYDYMQAALSSSFDYVVTEISLNNPRSRKAHFKQGFESLLKYDDVQGESWEIVIWKL